MRVLSCSRPRAPKSILRALQSTCCGAKMGVYFATLETPLRPCANIDVGGAGAHVVFDELDRWAFISQTPEKDERSV